MKGEAGKNFGRSGQFFKLWSRFRKFEENSETERNENHQSPSQEGAVFGSRETHWSSFITQEDFSKLCF